MRVGALKSEAAYTTSAVSFGVFRCGGALAGNRDSATARATGKQRAHHVGAWASQVKQRGAKALPQLQRKLDQAKRAGRGLCVSRRALGCG